MSFDAMRITLQGLGNGLNEAEVCLENGWLGFGLGNR